MVILEAISWAGRVKSNRIDEQKELKSIWITGSKPILFLMKFVIVLIFLLYLPLTTVGPVKGLTWTLNIVKVTTSCLTYWNPIWPISLYCYYEPCSSFFNFDWLQDLLTWVSSTSMTIRTPLTGSTASPWCKCTLFKSGAPAKHHAALKLLLKGQDLAQGHINRNCLYIF